MSTSPSTFSDPFFLEPLSDFVKQQVVELGLENEQEYYEGLALAEQQRKTVEFYEREIQKGLDSLNDGPFIQITPEYWEKMDQEIERRYLARQKETG